MYEESDKDFAKLDTDEWKRISKEKDFFSGFIFGMEEEFKKLTEIQQRFIMAYSLKDIKGWDVNRAYMYAARKWDIDPIKCRVSAQKNLHKPHIKKFLERIDWMRVEQKGFTAQRILEEEQRLAYSNITKYLDEDGLIPVTNLKSLPDDVTAAIRSVEVVVTKEGEKKYKITLWDKGQSLSRLQKCKGLQQEKVDITSKNLDFKIDENTDPKEAAKIYAQLIKGNFDE